MSCHESNHLTLISSDGIIGCKLFPGDASASPPIPTTIQIPVEQAIAANTEIQFTILNIKNPTLANYNIGISARLLSTCENGDKNNLCGYFHSTQYIKFDSTPSIPSTGSNWGSMNENPAYVSATNVQHTFTGPFTVNSGDYVKIVYFPQVPIPATCTITSGNGLCYSYPLEDTIIIKATSTQSGSYTFTLGGMTNLYQSRVTEQPYSEVWDTLNGNIRGKFTTNYWVDHIRNNPADSAALEIDFNPTLTPDYQLKYGFNNIARIEVTHLLQN